MAPLTRVPKVLLPGGACVTSSSPVPKAASRPYIKASTGLREWNDSHGVYVDMFIQFKYSYMCIYIYAFTYMYIYIYLCIMYMYIICT